MDKVYSLSLKYNLFWVDTAKFLKLSWVWLLLVGLMIICATIEKRTINPTNEQAQACVRVCQMLSNTYGNVS
ncbi:hypothetical protein H6G36_06475 [Anabaena minutissima FACHB-250]|nr:hypothetical protein [Anabaena minutissima FACHB-250]